MPPTFAVCFAVFINLNRTPRLLIGVVICRAGGILFSTIFKGEFAVLWSSCSPVLLSVSEHSRDHVEFYLWTMCNISLSKKVVYCNAPAREQPRRTFMQTWGPYLNDVYTIFRILDPLPPCLHFGKIHKTKSTQPPLLHLHFVNPPSPLSVDII